MAWILARRVATRKKTPNAMLMESIERMTEFGRAHGISGPFGRTEGYTPIDQAAKNLADAKKRREDMQRQYEAAKASGNRAAASRFKLKMEQLDREIKRLQKVYDNLYRKLTKERGQRLSSSFKKMGEGAEFVSWSTRMSATPMGKTVSVKYVPGGYSFA